MAITLGSWVRVPDTAVAQNSQALELTDRGHGMEFKTIFSRSQGLGRTLGPMGSRNDHLIALGGNFHSLSAGTMSLLSRFSTLPGGRFWSHPLAVKHTPDTSH